jgi:hypothetical protein
LQPLIIVPAAWPALLPGGGDVIGNWVTWAPTAACTSLAVRALQASPVSAVPPFDGGGLAFAAGDPEPLADPGPEQAARSRTATTEISNLIFLRAC